MSFFRFSTPIPSLAEKGAAALVFVKPEAVVPADRDRVAQLLSAEERRRWRGFVAEGAALQFLVARGLLRTVLSRYADVAPERWRFATNAYGKPFIAEPVIRRDLRFNLSHTEGLAALVVSEGFDCGVDVEATDREAAVAELAPLVLSRLERIEFDGLEAAERQALFYRLWTLKEAYTKALGVGVSLPFESVTFDLKGGFPRLADDHDAEASGWSFRTAAPTERHGVAVAARTPTLHARVSWAGA